MDVRLQTSMVFHLDKCIGCHTCSIACKNVWTDRKGAEYMWWNNVETKPGTGYPTAWEDQDKYNGGWTKKEGKPDLKMGGKSSRLLNIFHNPDLPKLDDYYEPWTYEYEELFDAPEGDDQPTARPISMITGDYMEIKAGPNWDDDLSGSPVYAANDPNLESLTEEQREELFNIERLVFFYLAENLQSLSESELRRGVSFGSDLQTRRRRRCFDQSGQMPGVAYVRYGMSIQKDFLQLVNRKKRKMHSLFSASRNWTSTRLLPFVRRTNTLSRRSALRCR